VRFIRWTAQAADQFEAAVQYIQQDNPTVGRTMAQAILSRIDGLANSPGVGRPGEIKGTRELVVSPYVIVYRYTDEIVEVLFIWHGAQDWR
jgi:addiction module RelE/StbE family toxin